MAKRALKDTVTDPVKKFVEGGEEPSKKEPSKKEPSKKEPSKKEPSKKKPLENFNTKLPGSLIIKVKVHCAKNRLKIQDFVAGALKARLKAVK